MAIWNAIPFIGKSLPNPEEQALEDQFAQMAKALEQYRGYAGDARQKEMGSQLGMYGPAQAMMAKMAPDLPAYPTDQALQSFQGVTAGAGPAQAAGPFKLRGQ